MLSLDFVQPDVPDPEMFPSRERVNNVILENYGNLFTQFRQTQIQEINPVFFVLCLLDDMVK
jgi:hypothetical protein